MSYGTPQPGDDAQLRAWRRRYAEDTERGFSLRLPLALARRLRAEAAARGVPHSRYAADLLRAALGDLPGDPACAAVPPPPAGAADAPTPDAPPPDARGQVDLRTLRVIQLREGRAGEPHPLDTVDRATVLRVLRADLAWVEDTDRRATREASAHD
jgi:transposase-like protein